MDLIVVPFLLAAHVPPNTDLPPIYLESTFNAHVDTELTIVDGNKVHYFLVNLATKLICNATADDRLTCYIRDPNLTISSTIMTKSEPVLFPKENKFHIRFNDIFSIPIELLFDTIGIMDYRISGKVHAWSDFLDLVQTITSQMNIGNICVRELRPIRDWDRTCFGSYITNYTVDHRFENLNLTIPKYKFNLKSISNFEIEDTKAILIEKQRYIELCDCSSYDMFGIKHINTSFPVHHKIKESTSRMKISIQDFVSTTENRYKLYNQKEQEVGNAKEHIYLELGSI